MAGCHSGARLCGGVWCLPRARLPFPPLLPSQLRDPLPSHWSSVTSEDTSGLTLPHQTLPQELGPAEAFDLYKTKRAPSAEFPLQSACPFGPPQLFEAFSACQVAICPTKGVSGHLLSRCHLHSLGDMPKDEGRGPCACF